MNRSMQFIILNTIYISTLVLFNKERSRWRLNKGKEKVKNILFKINLPYLKSLGPAFRLDIVCQSVTVMLCKYIWLFDHHHRFFLVYSNIQKRYFQKNIKMLNLHHISSFPKHSGTKLKSINNILFSTWNY